MLCVDDVQCDSDTIFARTRFRIVFLITFHARVCQVFYFSELAGSFTPPSWQIVYVVKTNDFQ
jgi:hypothetical protein